MSPRKNTERRPTLRERAATGDYDLVEPLDYLILELLPNEGELVMDYYPMGKTAAQLVKERFQGMSAGQMSGCVKRLETQGLAKQVRTGSGRMLAYQRTLKGQELHAAWKKTQAPDKSGGGK